MFHRGPDGLGEYQDSPAGSSQVSRLFMTMRRLSIIDLRGGWQPLHNEDKSLALIVNGEIYNHVELREELLARGHHFRTGSDCEVMVHLYEEYGLDFVHHLRGMFAFALWDSKRHRLLLGRDRMGEKPLYLRMGSDKIWFASELKALMAARDIPLDIDPSAVHSFLHYGWIPEPQSAIRDITKLPPGHILSIDLDTWSWRQSHYWRIEDSAPVSAPAIEAVRHELETIGKQIVRADVPIGVALSGGLDSSVTAALAAKYGSSDVRAFTVGYEGNPGQDERDLARAFANDTGLPFHSIEISTSDMVAAFPALCFERDDPIADIAGYGYYAVSQAARAEGCPVLLQGQGADELLWGYAWAVQAVTHSLRKLGNKPVGNFAALWAQRPKNLSRPQLVRFAYLLGGLCAGWRSLSPGMQSPAERLVAYDLTDPYQIGAHAAATTYTPEFLQRVQAETSEPAEFFRYAHDGNSVDIQLIALQCRGYLLQNGLAQGDRLAMANSVELRLPFVDYRLVETLVGLQKHKPLYSATPKSALHGAARDLVPAYMFQREKRGFNPPVSNWINALRAAYGKDLVQGALVQQRILSSDAAQRLTEDRSRFGVHNDLFLKYLVLEFWCRGMTRIADAPRRSLCA
jgi:asparagine synthase (glutamine-hydrolysing)